MSVPPVPAVDWREQTCRTCGHTGKDHEANECWVKVDGKQCGCTWLELTAIPAVPSEPPLTDEARGIALTALYNRHEIPGVDQHLATEHAEWSLRLIQRGLSPHVPQEQRTSAQIMSALAASVAYLLHQLRDLDTGTAADAAYELTEAMADGQGLIDWLGEYLGADVAEAITADELKQITAMGEPS